MCRTNISPAPQQLWQRPTTCTSNLWAPHSGPAGRSGTAVGQSAPPWDPPSRLVEGRAAAADPQPILLADHLPSSPLLRPALVPNPSTPPSSRAEASLLLPAPTNSCAPSCITHWPGWRPACSLSQQPNAPAGPARRRTPPPHGLAQRPAHPSPLSAGWSAGRACALPVPIISEGCGDSRYLIARSVRRSLGKRPGDVKG